MEQQQFKTDKFKRDNHSKALISTDTRGLEKHYKQKLLAEQIITQQQHINKLEQDINLMKQAIDKLLSANQDSK